MKITTATFLILLIVIVGLASAQTMTMKVGEKKQIAMTGRTVGAPANWMSSDSHVATVINSQSPQLNGTVIAHGEGTATITATANGAQSATTVNVTR